MIQSENLVLEHPEQKNSISKEQLLELKRQMNSKALAKRRARTGLRVTANLVLAFVVLLPLLYAVSIAFMPSGELFTMDLNLVPKNPTFSNFTTSLTVT